MTALRWLSGQLARGAAGALGLALLGLLLADLVERGAQGQAPWGPSVEAAICRAPLVIRELLAVLLGLALAWTVARLRSRGALLALGASGVSARWLRAALAGVIGVGGLSLALGLELAAPALRDAGAAAEARAAGAPAQFAARWASGEGGWLRVSPEGGLTWVAVGEEGVVARLDAPRASGKGGAWTFDDAVAVGITENGLVNLGPGDVALPSPESLDAWTQRASPSEASLWELDDAGVEASWRRHRAASLLAPAFVAWAVGAFVLASAAPPAAAVGVSAALLVVWQLLSLVLAQSPLAGWAPLLVLLALGAAAATRPARWTP